MPSETTPNLVLPYILAAQSQKHVTHNEAIRALDALAQLSVLDRDLAAPPPSPAEGARYIVGASPAGAWAGQTNKIAAWQDGAWAFYAPREGWVAWTADEDQLVAWNGAAWIDATSVNPAPLVGVNATADAANRFAVSSPASLFNHAGAGHQVKVNKAAAANTASLLFQTGFSGRAEMGTAGDDNFHIKVSADGSSFAEAAVFKSSGAINVNQLVFDRPAGTHRAIDYLTSGVSRWTFLVSGDAETGGNAGSILQLHAYSDAGAYLGTLLTASRQSQSIELPFTKFSVSDGFTSFAPLKPSSDNALSVGTSALRWSVIYAATGTINTSDARMKTDIADCPLGLDFILDLEPRLYRWREGGADVTFEEEAFPVEETVGGVTRTVMAKRQGKAIETKRPGRRLHAGFLAQNVKAALDRAGVDCGLWVLDDKDDPEGTQSLRYDQFIAPLVKAVQELAARVERLEAQARA